MKMNLFKYPIRFISIESKRNLKEFQKLIHPDLMMKAPVQVKEENLRSLKILNDYLDNIKQNNGNKSLKLKFFAPDKENQKSKKFLYFEAHMNSIPSSLSEDLVNFHYDKAITILTNGLKAVQIENQKLKVSKFIELEQNKEEPQTIDEYVKMNKDSIIKSSYKKKQMREMEDFQRNFKNHIQKKTQNYLQRKIRFNLVEEIENTLKEDNHSKEIMEELTQTVLMKKMKELNVQYGVFFISENIQEEHDLIFDFFVRLLKFNREKGENNVYYQIQKFILSRESEIKILLNIENKISPGFLHINIRQSIDDNLAFIIDQVNNVIEQRQSLVEEDNSVEQLRKEITDNFSLKIIELQQRQEDTETQQSQNRFFLIKLHNLLNRLKENGFWMGGYKIQQNDNINFHQVQKILTIPWNFKSDAIYNMINSSINQQFL